MPALLLLSHELVNAAFKDEETFPSAGSTARSSPTCWAATSSACTARSTGATARWRRPRSVNGSCRISSRRCSSRSPTSSSTASRPTARPTSSASSRGATRSRSSCACSGCRRRPRKTSRRWALGMLDIQQNYENAVRCSQEFTAFVDPILQERRTDPADDLISTLATDGDRRRPAHRRRDHELPQAAVPRGRRHHLPRARQHAVRAAHEPRPARARASRDSPRRSAAGPRRRACAGTPPVALAPAHNPRDVVWHDIAIPADTPLIFAIMAANRDPDGVRRSRPLRRHPPARRRR